MRYTREHRADARARIVAAAAGAIRERGLAEASIAEITARAGLTHGAFYHHFADRDELIAEAVNAAAAETGARVFADAGDSGTMLARYCSREHAATPGSGCVLAALGTEATHHEARPVRDAFARTARGFLERVASVVQATREPAAARTRKRAGVARAIDDETLALASRMLGAVILARLVDDERLAARLLSAARR